LTKGWYLYAVKQIFDGNNSFNYESLVASCEALAGIDSFPTGKEDGSSLSSRSNWQKALKIIWCIKGCSRTNHPIRDQTGVFGQDHPRWQL
jgi:hypothetical protein